MNQIARLFGLIALLIVGIVIIGYIMYGIQLKKPVNIFDALEDDHSQIRRLIYDTYDDPGRFSELKTLLDAHHRLEEQIPFEVLKTQAKLRKDTLEAIEEHHVIELLLSELDSLPKKDERWLAKFDIMQEFTEHHLEEEEEQLFPESRKLLSKGEMNGMGVRFEEEKAKLLKRP